MPFAKLESEGRNERFFNVLEEVVAGLENDEREIGQVRDMLVDSRVSEALDTVNGILREKKEAIAMLKNKLAGTEKSGLRPMVRVRRPDGTYALGTPEYAERCKTRDGYSIEGPVEPAVS